MPNVFERRYLTAWDKSLDVQRMREAAALLCGTHDYRAFSSVNKRFKKSTVRTVERIEVTWDKSLDVQRMREAAALLCGTHDYRAFSSVNKRFKKSTVRTVERIEVTEHGGEIRLDFFGDGFLYHMVRILTGTLVEIGAGERQADSIRRAFETLDRQDAGVTMPPQGLILTKIFY